jgi:hypothetical protein
VAGRRGNDSWWECFGGKDCATWLGGTHRKCGVIFLELYLLGALESVLKLSPYDDGPKVPVQVLFGYFS